MSSDALNDIILNCDWFALGKRRLIKQLSYHIPSKDRSFLHVFRFPSALRKYANHFNNQSVHSHGIPWDKNGFFHLNDVTRCILSLKYVHGGPDVVYWAKGNEKCRVLSDYGIAVNNLEDIGCPRFTDLSILPVTTLNKAKVFGDWLQSYMERQEPTLYLPVTPDYSSDETQPLLSPTRLYSLV